jgi:GTP-binding protein Era
MTKAGIVTVAGKPNAGKSTLLNRIIGQKLSIVSPKPQSTRGQVVGIRTENDVQMVILDTPGLLSPAYALQHAMRASALQPLAQAANLKDAPHAPIILALNKIDAIARSDWENLEASHPGAHLISASTGEGIDRLLDHVTSLLPDGPLLYPDDEISTQTVRFFCAELVRETALEQLEDEVPYSIACAIEEFREQRIPVYIRAVLYVERESQKRILIGARGTRVRELGRTARAKIEEFLGAAVYLDLWVKVLPNWRRNAAALRRFGYRLPKERPS